MSARATISALALASLAFAAFVELLDATGALVPGRFSGDQPTLVTVAVMVGLAATVTAAGAVVVGPAWARALPVAAAAFLVARFESYDPYYAPFLRRMSDHGLVASWWVWLLCVAAVAVAVVPRARPVAVAVLLLIACTGLVADAGH